MKIRSVTAFAPRGLSPKQCASEAAGVLAAARETFQSVGYEVQTVRLALPPIQVALSEHAEVDAWPHLAAEFETAAKELAIDYVALGPVLPEGAPEIAPSLARILAATERTFVTTLFAVPETGLHPAVALDAARTIVEAAPLEPDGFANLRYSALANVPAGVPFLPAAYSDGDGWSMALATESASLARAAFAAASHPTEGSAALVAAIEDHGGRIAAAAEGLCVRAGWRFRGIDFSPAPFPADSDSVGMTLESIGVSTVGGPGTVTAAAILTSAVRRARVPLTGFSGLFLPVLEDAGLAARAAEGTLRLEDLLLASTVCGTGLDTVPLPGDVTPEDILPWLLDLGALALRLDKPLTARLMPMPGRVAGDPLEIDFPFFASGRVMSVRRGRWTGGTQRDMTLPIEARRSRS